MRHDSRMSPFFRMNPSTTCPCYDLIENATCSVSESSPALRSIVPLHFITVLTSMNTNCETLSTCKKFNWSDVICRSHAIRRCKIGLLLGERLQALPDATAPNLFIFFFFLIQELDSSYNTCSSLYSEFDCWTAGKRDKENNFLIPKWRKISDRKSFKIHTRFSFT